MTFKSSSNVYHISPLYLRNLGIERSGKRDKGYGEGGGNVYRYNTLYESIEKEGFKEEFPIVVMLCRENNADQIDQGHHRLDIAIKLGLETVPVRFIIDEINDI
jgi:hypothetical protein